MRRPRPRRFPAVLKWAFTIAAALTLAVWLLSGWFGLNVTVPAGPTAEEHVVVAYGVAQFRKTVWTGGAFGTPQRITWEVDRAPSEGSPDWYWRFRNSVRTSHLTGEMITSTTFTYIQVPLWPLVPAASLLDALLWLFPVSCRRRGLCPRCGYSRAGLPSPESPCPECGAAART